MCSVHIKLHSGTVMILLQNQTQPHPSMIHVYISQLAACPAPVVPVSGSVSEFTDLVLVGESLDLVPVRPVGGVNRRASCDKWSDLFGHYNNLIS